MSLKIVLMDGWDFPGWNWSTSRQADGLSRTVQDIDKGKQRQLGLLVSLESEGKSPQLIFVVFRRHRLSYCRLTILTVVVTHHVPILSTESLLSQVSVLDKYRSWYRLPNNCRHDSTDYHRALLPDGEATNYCIIREGCNLTPGCPIRNCLTWSRKK